MRTNRPSELQMVAYDLPLRRDVLIRLVLPVDLTEEEAERLSGIIRTLAFPAATLDQALAAARAKQRAFDEELASQIYGEAQS